MLEYYARFTGDRKSRKLDRVVILTRDIIAVTLGMTNHPV
jgi:hypothetical protein